MDLSPVIIAIPLYFLLIFIELGIQYFTGRKIYRLEDALSNISCGIIQQLSGLFLKIMSLGVFLLIYEHLRVLTIEVSWISGIVLFIAADFCYYWAHRISHEVNLFWGGHVVHHQSEDYNFSVALRQSSFQVVWTFFFYLPLAFLGFNPTQFVFVSALVTIYQFWIHTETIGRLGWLEIIFNTPSHHRVHHGRNPKYIDRNHAGVLIIWDKMFGTFQQEEERPTYGITKPLNSWNPVWANLEHYDWMYKNLRMIKGWKNKIKFIFAKPGWFPEEMGGYQPAPEVDSRNYQKFNLKAPARLSIYIFAQFISILALTALFLFTSGKFTLAQNSLPVFYIIFSCLTLGILSENSSRAMIWEAMRLLVIPSLFVSSELFGSFTVPILLGTASVVWSLLAIIYFTWIIWSFKKSIPSH